MNKKLIIMAALCGFALGANAQTEKGKVSLGGGIGYNTQPGNGNSTRTHSFNFIPRAGYFVSNNFVIGAGLGFIYSKNKILGPNNTYLGLRQSTQSIAPYARYYFDITPRFKFFGDLQVGAGKGNAKQTDENGKTLITYYKYKEYSGTLSPGFAFFATKKLAIELSTVVARYQDHKFKGSPFIDQNNINYFALGLSTIKPTFAINFHL